MVVPVCRGTWMAFSEAYQKQVALLMRVLPFIADEDCFALKGGTAINFFIRNMPRLSVDIDLTYLPVAPRPESLAAIEAALKRIEGRIEGGIPGCHISEGRTEGTVAKISIRTQVQTIVDECHHLRAVSFELVARRSKARYVLCLSATVARKDGHHPIIFMQCGPVRYRVDAKSQAATRSFSHKVRLRETGFRLKTEGDTPGPNQIAALYAALAQDEQRNDLIFDDVLFSLEVGRRPVLLTERRDHHDYLRARFEKFTRNLVVLYGGMSVTERRAAQDGLTL